MLRQLLLFLLPVLALTVLPTFSPKNQLICSDFGFNWAAEIRCLRDIIHNLTSTNQSVLPSRGSRSLTLNPPEPYPLNSNPYSNPQPYSYLRPYGRPYYKHQLTQIPKPTVPSCTCDGLEKLETKFEKKLYDVKMRAQWEAEEKVKALEKRFENDFREYQRITTMDIIAVKRKIVYVEAPRTMDNEFVYFYISREESWYGASEHCIGYGGHLASVHSAVDNALISSLIPTNMTAWIGLNDVQKENVFKFTDGTPVDFKRWAAKQPNNEEHNENCVEVDNQGHWNDKLCLILRPYVCKKPRRD